MEAASEQMAHEYERVRQHATEDPGTAGDQGEENWAALLRSWLPSGYHVVTIGRILGLNARSPQVDLLVLSPAYPTALLDTKLYLAAGVRAAFECKLTLDAGGVRHAVESAVAVRRVLETYKGTPHDELFTSITFGLLAHSHDWKGEASTPGENLERLLLGYDRELVEHPREMLDLACVADLGTWIASKTTFLGPSIVGPTWPATRDLYGYPDEGCCSTMFFGPLRTPTQPIPRPIGVMFSKLLQQLAWDNHELRPLADYWRVAGMFGPGAGNPRVWATDAVYSPDVAASVRAGRIVQDLWSPWSMFYL